MTQPKRETRSQRHYPQPRRLARWAAGLALVAHVAFAVAQTPQFAGASLERAHAAALLSEQAYAQTPHGQLQLYPMAYEGFRRAVIESCRLQLKRLDAGEFDWHASVQKAFARDVARARASGLYRGAHPFWAYRHLVRVLAWERATEAERVQLTALWQSRAYAQQQTTLATQALLQELAETTWGYDIVSGRIMARDLLMLKQQLVASGHEAAFRAALAQTLPDAVSDWRRLGALERRTAADAQWMEPLMEKIWGKASVIVAAIQLPQDKPRGQGNTFSDRVAAAEQAYERERGNDNDFAFAERCAASVGRTPAIDARAFDALKQRDTVCALVTGANADVTVASASADARKWMRESAAAVCNAR